MQQRRHVADHFKSNKSRQHEYEQRIDQVGTHATPSLSSRFSACQPATHFGHHPAGASAGSLKNSRTRAFTISPPWVISVSRTISSCKFSCNLPSFTMYVRYVVM